MFKESIINFPKQFSWEPQVVNENHLIKPENIIVAGMGGSHLAAGLMQICLPSLPLIIHKDYSLPKMPTGMLKKNLVIASSYSGNTEETLDAFNTALAQKIALAVITTGGKLLELAQKNNIPYIQLPNDNFQPRLALGYSLRAMFRLLDETSMLGESDHLASTLDVKLAETTGHALAQKLQNKIPVIYSSSANSPLAYIWKIKINETGKIPAFFSVFPELNHNEMSGFDIKEKTRPLTEKFHFVFLQNKTDHPQILKRMDITKTILEQQGLPVNILPMIGDSKLCQIFGSLIIADWTSYYLAELYGIDPEKVPMVESFKNKLANQNN